MTAKTVETVPEGGGDEDGMPGSATDASARAAGLSRYRAARLLADLAVGGIIIRKADGGRRLRAI